MKVIGIDPSSKKVAALICDDNKWTSWTFELNSKKASGNQRARDLAEIRKEVENFFLDESLPAQDLWVFVEQPLVGRGGAHAAIVISQVQGIILSSAVSCGANNAYIVNVQTWKKAVVGRGNAGKPDVREWLELHHPSLLELAGDDQDLVDAACLAIYGRDVIRRGESLV